MTAPAADPVAAWLDMPRALLARMAEVRGHIEDMGSDERVFMLGALAGSLQRSIAALEAVLATHRAGLGRTARAAVCDADQREMPCPTLKAIASALRDAQGGPQAQETSTEEKP